MTKLEELYIDYLNSDECSWESRIPQVQEASKAMDNLLNKLFADNQKNYLEFDEVNSELNAAYEEQGFYAGFKYAMRLAKECF